MPDQTIVDRISGCLLAGALGDAIGAHFEGKASPVNFELPTDLRITDDTQLTIATCESIVEAGSVDAASVANHLLRWYRERRISGIGSSTLKALTELDAGGHWALVGATGEFSAGNGAAMRIAPLAFMLDPDTIDDRRSIRDVCRITHRSDEAYIGALAILRSIRHAACGKGLDEELLPLLVESLPDSRVRDRLAEICRSPISVHDYASRFATTGYVVDAVPLAILAATRSSDLLMTIQDIVQCGGDTDTIASMFGHIYGAAQGATQLPNQVDALEAAPLIKATAIRFADVVARV